MQFHIDSVESRSGAPLLLHFQNGYVSENFSKCHSEVQLLRDDEKHVVALDIEGMLYAGEEIKEELDKTLLLVRDRTTGKVRVVETGSVSLRAVTESSSRVTNEVTALNVSRKFGSKRDRKVMEQRERLKVNSETMNEQFKKVAENRDIVKGIDLQDFTKTNSEDFYIPHINREATNVCDVYKISDIITTEEIERVSNEIEGKDWTEELSVYFKSFCKKSTNSTDHALLLYANSLLKLYSSPFKELSKKSFVACEISNTINDICIERFMQNVNGKRTRPNQLKDKTLCHIIVFILLLKGYNFDLDDFANAVKISPVTLIMKTRAVGAHVSPDKKTVTLKIPLNTAKSFLANKRKSAKF